MGRFSTTVHIKSNVDRMRFVNTFSDVMKKRGFAPCSEDEAAVSYLLAFGEGWVALANEDYKNDPQKSSDDVREMSKALKTSAFSVEVVDSDFAIMTLCAANGSEDRLVVGDGSGYGVDEAEGDRKMWEPLLADGKTCEQFSEAAAAQEVFVEDTLGKVAAVLGIDPYYMAANHDEVLAKADDNKNITTFYFKKAAAKEKTMTLRTAFFKVFGEALEPLGYKKIKSKYPYLVRVVNDEIIHCISVINETAPGIVRNCIKYKCFNVFCGVLTVYKGEIDFDFNPSHTSFVNSVWKIYTQSHWFDQDMKYRDSIRYFYYNPTSAEYLVEAMKKVLKVVEESAMPVINQAVTLRSCMNYFALMNHRTYPSLHASDEGLLCTKLFSADEFVDFRNDLRERDYKMLSHELNTKVNLSPEIKEGLEMRMKNNLDGREEAKKKNYEKFTDPELQEKAPAELERRKKENIEKLRGYGLDI